MEVLHTTTQCNSRLSPSLHHPAARPSRSPSSPPLQRCPSPQSDPAPHPSLPPSLILTLIAKLQVSTSSTNQEPGAHKRSNKVINGQLSLLSVVVKKSVSLSLSLQPSELWLSQHCSYICRRVTVNIQRFSFMFIGVGWEGRWGAPVPYSNHQH